MKIYTIDNLLALTNTTDIDNAVKVINSSIGIDKQELARIDSERKDKLAQATIAKLAMPAAEKATKPAKTTK